MFQLCPTLILSKSSPIISRPNQNARGNYLTQRLAPNVSTRFTIGPAPTSSQYEISWKSITKMRSLFTASKLPVCWKIKGRTNMIMKYSSLRWVCVPSATEMYFFLLYTCLYWSAVWESPLGWNKTYDLFFYVWEIWAGFMSFSVYIVLLVILRFMKYH